jgi:hypothetical protein
MAAVVALVLLLAAGLTALAQPDSPDQGASSADPQQTVTDDSATPAVPLGFQGATSPQLACGVQVMPDIGAGFQTHRPLGAAYTCWVAGAPAGDTSFSVDAARMADTDGGMRSIGQVCEQSPLSAGGGTCQGMVTDTTGPLLGGVFLTATFQPSGTQIGPVNISPTRAGL